MTGPQDHGEPTRRTVLRALGASAAAGGFAAPAGATDAGGLVGGFDAHQEANPYTCHPSQRNYAEVSEEGPYDVENAVVEVVDLESDQDDETVQVGVVRPDPERVDDAPVIVRATPYVDDLHDVDVAQCWGVKRLTHNFVQHGYAVGVVAVRGTGGSGGCMDLFGPAERRDVDQAITWLGEAEWSNGNVAMSGGSYDGTTPFEVAGMGNPHLKTIVPMSGVPDVHELMYWNGAPESRGPLVLNSLYYGISLGFHTPVYGTSVDTFATRATCPDEYADGWTASVWAGATGQRDPSGYWAGRNLRPLVERNYEGSIFYVQGMQDWNVDPSQMYPWTETLEEIDDIEMRYMLGQFGHAYPDDGSWEPGTRRNDWADIALRWYDRELKGKDVDVGPTAYVQDSTGEWRAEETWPPERAEPECWYLRPDDALSRESADETGTRVVAVDPENHAALFYPGGVHDCETCARFETEPFGSEYRFAGQPEIEATVTPTGPGGYLTAYLYAVDEEGEEERLGWGMLDLRYPDRGESPQPVVPGEPIDVSLPIAALDARVPEGSRLALVLHQGTTSDRIGGTPPFPVQLEVGDGGAFLTVDHFEASPDPEAAPYPVEEDEEEDGGDESDSAVRADREVDSTLVVGGEATRVRVTVDAPAGTEVRDTVPESWTIEGDVQVRDVEGTRKHLVLGSATGGGETTFEYDAVAPTGHTASGPSRFGPIAVGADGDWEAVDGTRETAYVVGEGTTDFA